MASMAFYFFGALAVLFSILVISLRNPITSALSLVVSFFAVSGVFVLLHAPFLAVIQILVYVGAILVLFLYVSMLLRLKSAEVSTSKQKIQRYMGFVLAPLMLVWFLAAIDLPRGEAPRLVKEFGSIASVGEVLLKPQFLLFEFVSVVLLVAIIGAVLLTTRTQKEAE